MTDLHINSGPHDAISASWQRCERDYKLKRNAAQPILRLQSSEVAPRLEEMIERTGGRHGIFRKLAKLASDAGHCLVITDNDGILVRLESKGAGKTWNGIALGSVWDERIAGTNGVSMALKEGRAFTVRGKDHYYSELKPFACNAIPLRDASNAVIGIANISSIDRGNPSDSLFTGELLSAAAHRLQHKLFEQAFKDKAIVSVAVPGRRELLKGAELVAVDENGVILGATAAAHEVSAIGSHDELTGCRVDEVFGTDLESLDRVPGRVMSVRRDSGPSLDLWVRTPVERAAIIPGWRAKPRLPAQGARQPTLKDLGVGSLTMSAICDRLQTSIKYGLPLVIEGETGTGKSALITALIGDAPQTVTIDCGALEDTDDDRTYIRSLMQQTRIASDMDGIPLQRSVLVFDNLDDLPDFAQTALRGVLNDMELAHNPSGCFPQIIATARQPLRQKVQSGAFRDDLFYMLASASTVLPPLRTREKPVVLAKAILKVMAGKDIELTSEAEQAIRAHDWPGNVRELRNVLRQALVHGDGDRITNLDLALITQPAARLKSIDLRQMPLGEEQLIRDALQGSRWNVSKAARTLGLGRATIHRKMKALGITRPT